jgi:putative restriction endonuclease
VSHTEALCDTSPDYGNDPEQDGTVSELRVTPRAIRQKIARLLTGGRRPRALDLFKNLARGRRSRWAFARRPEHEDQRGCGRARQSRSFHSDCGPSANEHFYAHVTDYLELDRAVPFKEGEFYYELGLRRTDGATSKGAFGRAVRNISDLEYDVILKAGFQRTLVEVEPGIGPSSEPPSALRFEEEPKPFERQIVEMVVARPFREAAFAASVKTAYANTCAMTGLQIINGGGRAEVQAAHIRPVAAGGSDSVRNGLALSGTIHWMFDRGLVSVDDNFTILIASSRLPSSITRLLSEDRKLALPNRPEISPHPAHLRYHRENIFKG